MAERDFSNREIMLMFNEIKLELNHIKEHTDTVATKLKTAEERIEKLGSFQTKVMTVWGLFVGAITIAINRFFT